jgi:prepilin-type N-terminal cleavage/methylation domain-containing protein
MITKMNKTQSMKNQQSGFTLVEIAIVLVIIGLLLGGILKGQELINSAKVKGLAQDFRTVQTALYGYQDRYKAIPGDHPTANPAINGATNAASGATLGNGQINGAWNSDVTTEESFLFWQHVRLAGFLSGPTDTSVLAEYTPKNAIGLRMGISSTMQMTAPTAMTGTYNICSTGILGKFAKQLDTQLDDGNTETGSFRVAEITAPITALKTSLVVDANSYVVCLAF